MKSKILSKLSPLVLLVPFNFYLASLVLAQSANSTPSTGLAVTPPTFELNGNPGDNIKNTVRLDNMHPYPVEIAVDLRNFTAVGEDGAVGITEEQNSFSLASWIEITPKTITLAPKTSQYFTFNIKVPLQAEPGGHFGSLIFRTIPTEKLEGSGASLAQEIGALVLLRIAGETVEQANIESFNPVKSLFEKGPVGFEIRVRNQGNVHTKPSGTIIITNMLGSQVASVVVEPKNILPAATRKLEAVWDTKWRLGRYSATYTAVLSDQTTRSATTTFTILPYRAIGVALVIVIILIIILKKYQKRLSLAWKILRSGKA
ncbi:hypothetical protein KBD69_02165 [Candidatus Woesebacteria bacterium]|nr:hypothetical protein [Candidatus Woesebacteria bacterium]